MVILYGPDVIEFVIKSIDSGLNVNNFYKRKLNKKQAEIIYKSMKNEFDTDILVSDNFDENQMREIYAGMENKLDKESILKYAKIKYPWHCMSTMRSCLENGFDFEEINTGDPYDCHEKIYQFSGILTDPGFIENGYRFKSEKYGYDVDLDDLKIMALEYPHEIFEQVVRAFKRGINPYIFMGKNFNAKQITTINDIMELNKDYNLPMDEVQLLFNPDIDAYIMYELYFTIRDIREGLSIEPIIRVKDYEEKVKALRWIFSEFKVPKDIMERICNHKLSVKNMELLAKACDRGINIDKYIDPDYNVNQLKEIFRGIENHVDVSKYDSKDYSSSEMEEIRLGLEHGVDIDQYINYQSGIMHLKRRALENNLPVDYYVNALKDGWTENRDPKENFNALNLYALKESEKNDI